MTGILHDLRYAIRQLGKSPSFAITVVITLGLGIGLNASIFSLVSGILLQKPSVNDPEHVVVATLSNLKDGTTRNPVSASEFLAWLQNGLSIGKMAAAAYDDVTMTGQGEPERLNRAQVSPNYFDLLGVSASLGRTFALGADLSNQEGEAVISYGLWKNRFANDPRVLGKHINLAGRSYAVIGVMPETFTVLPGQLWTPTSFVAESLRPSERDLRNLSVVLRLKEGVSIDEAQAQMETVFQNLGKDNPTENNWTLQLIKLQDFLVKPIVRRVIFVVMGVVGIVLLIACANVTGLLLSRSASRQHEFAIRSALGAGRVQIIRLMLIESLLLALSGGGLGLLLSTWGVEFLRTQLIEQPLLAAKIGVNGQVLLFAFVISCLTTLVFGMLPALQSSRLDPQVALKEGAQTALPGAKRSRMRSTIVVGEIALAMVLIVCTQTVIQVLVREIRVRLGFDPQQVLTVNVSLDASKYPDPTRQAAFFSAAIERIQSLPGVRFAGLTQWLPESFPPRIAFEAAGQPRVSRPEERPLAGQYIISPDYFQAMRIPLIRGRSFSSSDSSTAANVVVVNETFTKQFFPNSNPIGSFIQTYDSSTSAPEPREIVGVVGDVVDSVGQSGNVPQLYVPFLQNPMSAMEIVVRANADPIALAPELRKAIWAIDENQPIGTPETMTKFLQQKGTSDRLVGGLLGSFTALAFGLATIGIYGLVSYFVVERTHEIGLRMALGASKKNVLRLVVGRGAFLAGIGIGLGFLLALPIPRLLPGAGGNVWNTCVVLGIATALLAGASLLASYIPARRAAKVDPMEALRYE